MADEAWGVAECSGGGAQRAVARGALRVEAVGHVSGDGWGRGDLTPYVEKGVKK